jgi:hypothetical protein
MTALPNGSSASGDSQTTMTFLWGSVCVNERVYRREDRTLEQRGRLTGEEVSALDLPAIKSRQHNRWFQQVWVVVERERRKPGFSPVSTGSTA